MPCPEEKELLLGQQPLAPLAPQVEVGQQAPVLIHKGILTGLSCTGLVQAATSAAREFLSAVARPCLEDNTSQ